jgi:hypothetical protein
MTTGMFALADALSLLGVLMLLARYQPTKGSCQLIFGLVIEFFTVLGPLLLANSQTWSVSVVTFIKRRTAQVPPSNNPTPLIEE